MFAGTAQFRPHHLPGLLSRSTALQFVETNKELLADLPPPMAAAAYYRNEDLYMVGGSTEFFLFIKPACLAPWDGPVRPPQKCHMAPTSAPVTVYTASS